MGDVVNLRRARKARARDEKAEAAQENRARFGRSKAQKDEAAREAERRRDVLDGHRLERSPDGDD